MLTDIFARRYEGVTIWGAYQEPQRRLIVQLFQMLSEQICPFYVDKEVSDRGKAFWTDIHDKLAMELGFKSLSPLVYSYPTNWQGVAGRHVGLHSIHTVCENWALKAFDNSVSADRYIKERLSLVEIAFRKRGEEVADANRNLENSIALAKRRPVPRNAIVIPGDIGVAMRSVNAKLNAEFRTSIDELNARFQQSGSPLSYHNGFIQMSNDVRAQAQIESPFWNLLSDPKWKNVDTDMKEALDLRDTGGRDPAFYAARALESTIKIISDQKGWTQGNETGASRYIDNLARNGFIEGWETDTIKGFFSKVRNPLGHGPGSAPMINLSTQATEWAVETCMSWIKSLIRRM